MTRYHFFFSVKGRDMAHVIDHILLLVSKFGDEVVDFCYTHPTAALTAGSVASGIFIIGVLVTAPFLSKVRAVRDEPPRKYFPAPERMKVRLLDSDRWRTVGEVIEALTTEALVVARKLDIDRRTETLMEMQSACARANNRKTFLRHMLMLTVYYGSPTKNARQVAHIVKAIEARCGLSKEAMRNWLCHGTAVDQRHMPNPDDDAALPVIKKERDALEYFANFDIPDARIQAVEAFNDLKTQYIPIHLAFYYAKQILDIHQRVYIKGSQR